MTDFRAVLRLRLTHAYYGSGEVPVDVTATDAATFQADGLLLRQQGDDVLVVTDAAELPEWVSLSLRPRAPEVITVTRGAQWDRIPVVEAPLGTDTVALEPLAPSLGPKGPGTLTLAELRAAPQTGRVLTVSFDAPEVFWTYHVLGPGSEGVLIEDPDGTVQFDPLGPETLPDGRLAHVYRSRDALPARARTSHRFALKSPGPFGPTTLIPVLPAPGSNFVSRPEPGSSQTRAQSDMYVTIA